MSNRSDYGATMSSQWIVLVTDFVTVQEVYGPFDSQVAAHEWAELTIDGIYRVVELKPPQEPSKTVQA